MTWLKTQPGPAGLHQGVWPSSSGSGFLFPTFGELWGAPQAWVCLQTLSEQAAQFCVLSKQFFGIMLKTQRRKLVTTNVTSQPFFLCFLKFIKFFKISFYLNQ